jgi:hypothetical protein
MAPIDHTLADTQIGAAHGITTLPHLKDWSIGTPQRVTASPTRSAADDLHVPSDERGRTACATAIVAPGDARLPSSHRSRVRAADGVLRRGRRARDFEAGIASALEAILASPQFVFRSKRWRLRARRDARAAPQRRDLARVSRSSSGEATPTPSRDVPPVAARSPPPHSTRR